VLLKSIGRLSQRLEREELIARQRLDKQKKRLKIRPERFRRGPLVCGYVTGDFREFSPKFDTDLSKIMTYEPSLLRACSWSWSRSQRDAAEVYNRLAASCTEDNLDPQLIVRPQIGLSTNSVSAQHPA
jgi:hypothetical protein